MMAVVLAGCAKEQPNATPEGAVQEFIELMSSFHGNPSEAQSLFLMLSERAKSSLRARAERYGAASGKTIAPSAMIVPARLAPRFRAQGYSSEVVGRHALVEIAGTQPHERAQIPCVYEGDGWRIDLVLPDLPPLPKRGDGTR